MTISIIKLLLFILLFMIAGCVSTDDRREVKTLTQQCPDISGTYKNIGQFIESEAPTEPDPTIGAGDPSMLYPPESSIETESRSCTITGNGEINALCVLSQVLEVPWNELPADMAATDLVDTMVEIGKISNGVISVKLYKNKQVVRESYLGNKGRSYKCKDGSINIRERFHDSDGFASFTSTTVLALKPDVDDSLILELDAKAYGYAIIIPFSEHKKLWYRWKRIK